MNNWRTWLTSIFLVLPSIFLATAGIIELRDGTAVDAAFPVPNFLSNGTAMPKAAYRDAAGLLNKSNGLDGDAQISRAESMFYAGDHPEQALAVMENGLESAPASSEGWAYYTAMLVDQDPKKAGQALDQAFTVAPYDYFLAGVRARLGVLLWPDLNEQTRDEVLRQARVLWEEPSLRDELLPLLATSEGARLMTRAYDRSPETIRDINRWVEARRRKSSPQGS